MIKYIPLLLIIFILNLTTPVLAAEPGNGTIEGQVINGTAGGSSVAEQNIVLKIYQNDNEVDSTTAETDTEGRFIFDGLSTEPGYSYQITITFQEADYTSNWLSFENDETSKLTEVTVYDATTSDEAIKTAMSHTIMYIEEGSLQVLEYYLFVNESDLTYIGSVETDTAATKQTLRFSVPAGATELQPGGELMECCIYSNQDGFVDSMPVLPGTKEIYFSYTVDYKSGDYTFSRKVNYPIDSYDFLVQGAGTEVSGDQLTMVEPVDINGTQFNHLSGENLAPGGTLVAQISGLPDTGGQGAIIWVVLTLVVLGGSFGLNHLLRKGHLQPVPVSSSLEQTSQKLLGELAQLDDDFENGKIQEEVYHRIRNDKKSQLVTLMQKPEENSGHR